MQALICGSVKRKAHAKCMGFRNVQNVLFNQTKRYTDALYAPITTDLTCWLVDPSNL
jgi:hypothetical protein